MRKMPYILHVRLCVIQHEDDPPLGEKRRIKLDGLNTCIVDNKLLKVWGA